MGRVDGAIDSVLFNGYSQKFRLKKAPTQPLWQLHGWHRLYRTWRKDVFDSKADEPVALRLEQTFPIH